MELLLEPSTWAILAGIGLIAGFIDAVAGGGGLLSIPALLTLGISPHLALGTNKLAACFGSSMAAFTYYRQNLFSPTLWYQTFIATFLGAVSGTFLVYYIDKEWLEKGLPLIIIAIAIYTLVKPNAMGCKDYLPLNKSASILKQWLLAFPLGFYDGFAGPGTGAFWTISSTNYYRQPLLYSCGLARAMTFVSNLTSLAIFFALGQVNLILGLSMGLCMMLGSFIGARSAIKFGVQFIRPVFIIIVLLIAVKLAWSAW
ncbi:sulfite exporter TauE/SafE family protein [Shewanella nanhaiensis]|uniref:Probable membrane transporter protein n=1 Tax=Shewanella nanhaiensis TaxID=2864872 RepID=A0ABS7DYC1_9GAMM|nr:TSUP family transporter [Shewanella nanhaiensis]MBW8182275.1 TSUP family transporter [Shewanella nanhaiensis]